MGTVGIGQPSPRNRRGTMSVQTIELDCAPGWPRPGDLIAGVIEGTGLEPRESVGRLFGNWTWDYSDIPAERWKAVQPILKERITDLYHKGYIRYGSW
jgi:hypothetical protein